ncbi:MAG: O-antigen ligase family protein [Leptolyngbyaceae cyanobacterium CSU_1_3]|nr:O-antigen ligase family protein [Leptolyngbyaceae cyanobacterium CSU_1_3]
MSSDVPLLALLVALFYGAFTLLPDSHSLIVAWPWVFVWQVGLLCAVLWLLGLVWAQGKIQKLGNGFDYAAGLLMVGLVVSSALAEFPHQSWWYAITALCFMAALYALNDWLKNDQQRLNLLTWQGYLSVAFIVLSLILWISQTLIPELTRLQQIQQQFGVSLPFSFSEIQLRNWAPIGHQNYVAGYLTLAIPLLIGLCVTQADWRRWLWGTGIGLGLLDLYSTSSRGGVLGLGAALVVGFGVLAGRSQISRRWLGIAGVGTIAWVALSVLTNSRLRSLLANGNPSGELAYRLISATAGWQMGITHPLTGIGLGGELLLFQRYRPFWAGREAEMVYQLHSTPIQLWANLGLWGVFSGMGTIGLLAYFGLRWQKSENGILIGSLFAGLLAYSVQSLTDYQLDNVSISGTLIIFLAVLISEFRSEFSPEIEIQNPKSKIQMILPIVGLGILTAIVVSLVPIHRAWMLSAQGFNALSQLETAKTTSEKQNSLNTFEKSLTDAQKIAPWEPYYPYQLGWILGDLGFKNGDRSLFDRAISHFIQGNKSAPYQEFGQTNLGWLILDRDAKSAMQAFGKSAQLVPAKRGVFYGLGFSLLAQSKTDLAVEALTLELLRDPILISSPVWRTPQLQMIYAQVSKQLATKYDELLKEHSQPGILNDHLRYVRGLNNWWAGNFAAARSDLQDYGNALSRAVLDLAEGKGVDLAKIQNSTGGMTIAAWLNSAQRLDLLQKAWVKENRTAPPPEIIQQLADSLAKSTSFDQWLKQNAPSREVRRSRLGFGVVSRHIDGSIPQDYLAVVENIALNNLMRELLPSQAYFPELDAALQSDRAALLAAIGVNQPS